jgi:hypothetical protein
VRRRIFAQVFVAFLALMPIAFVFGGDHKPRQVKAESTIAEMSSRALAVRWPVDSPIVRLSIVTTYDRAEDDAVLAIAEFDDGTVGIFTAAQRPDQDRWVTVAKRDIASLNECTIRARSR